MTHYDLLLYEVDINDSNIIFLGRSTEPKFTINSSSIRENSMYSYTVRAINSVNVSSDSEEQIFCKFIFCMSTLSLLISSYSDYRCTAL